MITFNDLYEYIQTLTDKAILSQNTEEFPFLEEYATQKNYIDHFYGSNLYSDVVMDSKSDLTPQWYNIYTMNMLGFLHTHAYEYNKLYNTLLFEYEPIYNLDVESTITTTYGEKTNTDNFGDKNRSFDFGSDNVTSNFGSGTDSAITTNSPSGYNGDTFVDSDKTTTNSTHGQYTNTTVTATKTDSEMEDAYTDTHIESSHIDTVKEVRQGNQGVTSTQSMINEERQVALFNFYDIIFRDLILNLSENWYTD